MDSDKNKIPKTDEEWKELLSPRQYKVMREKVTEPPFTGVLLHEDARGMYSCAACGNKLFSSNAKFDSGTGWPSFDDTLPGAVRFEHDDSTGTVRTEVLCSKCGSHLGHIFPDGPTHTGNRYCINSVCLDFDKE